MKFIIDCDDVLYQTNETALKRLNSETKLDFSLKDITKWGPISYELDRRMKYFSDPEFVYSIPRYEGAAEFIKTLTDMGKVVLATSVPQYCAEARRNAIKRDFPIISDEDVVICGSKSHLRGDMMLDDSYINIKHSCTSTPVLLRKPWNSIAKDVLSVSTYQEFLDLAYSLLKLRKEGYA